MQCRAHAIATRDFRRKNARVLEGLTPVEDARLLAAEDKKEGWDRYGDSNPGYMAENRGPKRRQ